MAAYFWLKKEALTTSMSDLDGLSEAQAHAFLAGMRWQSEDHQVCPDCGVRDKHYFRCTRLQWSCKHCFSTFSVTSGTAFHGHKLKYRVLLKEEIRKSLRREFASLDDFLRRWTEAERKQAVIDELREQGIPLDVLREAVPQGEVIDAFDLIAHIAFDQPPLSRRERANNVRKRNYFGQYGEEARAVLEALLEKYADHGISDIEDPKILELPPFNKIGSKTQIRRGIFGGNERYSQALTELEQQIYQEQA